jgi:predicted MFS family arabinose efflux permease
VASLGWRGLFLVTGSIGMIWLIPWWFAAPRTLAAPSTGKREVGPSLGELLRNRSFWGTCGGLCGANYAWYFLLTWLPSYLVRERHFTLGSLALWGALPYLFMAVTSMSGGILADRLILRGGVPVNVRRALLVTGLVLTSAILPCVLLPRVELAVAALFCACLAFGVYASNVFSLTQSLAGPAASGRWTGFQNACGNLAGIVSPMIAGWIVTKTGGLSVAFMAASLACLLGAASFGFLVRERDRFAP